MNIIVFGGTQTQKKEKIKEICLKSGINLFSNNPDLLVIKPEKSIGIEEIRKIKSFLSQKSWQKNGQKLVVIENGQMMTIEAQNALLKTLEEPPKNSLIIITTNNLASLLPTIISRCQVSNLGATQIPLSQKDNYYWPKFSCLPIAEKMKFLSRLKKENLTQWLEENIFYLQKKLTKEKGEDLKKISSILKLLIRAQKMLDDNLYFQWVIDWLILKM